MNVRIWKILTRDLIILKNELGVYRLEKMWSQHQSDKIAEDSLKKVLEYKHRIIRARLSQREETMRKLIS